LRAANDGDEIVGSARRGGGRGHRGFLLKSGPLQQIGGLPGSDYSAALGINDLGQVVGLANTATGMRAFRSRRTTGIVALGTLPGDSGSVALAINHPGRAVGYSSGPTGVRAVVWTPAGAIQALPLLPQRLGPRPRNQRSRGCRRSLRHRHRAAGGALGGRRRSGSRHASRPRRERGAEHQCQRRDRRILRGPRGPAPRRALAVGRRPHPGSRHASDGTSSRALAINDRGEVVGISEASAGDHAFLWTEQDGMQDLNGLLTSRFGFVLTHAVAISAQGVIVASRRRRGHQRGTGARS